MGTEDGDWASASAQEERGARRRDKVARSRRGGVRAKEGLKER